MRRGRAINGQTVSAQGQRIAGDLVEPAANCPRGPLGVCDCKRCLAARRAAAKAQQGKVTK